MLKKQVTAITILGLTALNSYAEVTFLNSKAENTALPFSEAVKVDNTLYISGQIGLNPDTKKLAQGGVVEESKQILTNIEQILNKYDYQMKDVVKCMVMLTNINDFKAFNVVYSSHFTPPCPARSAFAVKELALGSSVEVECMAAK